MPAGKTIPDAVMDAMLAAAQGDRICICHTEPTTWTQASTFGAGTGYMLAIATIVPGTDFIKANGDTSGRKNTLSAKNLVAIVNTGVAGFVAICDSTGSVKRVTTCPAQTLTNGGGTVDIAASIHELLDPT